MSEAKHTPGPFRFLEAGSTESEGNAGRPLTICSPANDDLANVYSSDDATVNVSREEAIANAHLFAASADLLAAAEWAANYIDTIIDPHALNVLRSLRAAIAKATGAA